MLATYALYDEHEELTIAIERGVPTSMGYTRWNQRANGPESL